MTIPRALRERGLLSTGDVAKKANVHRSTVWLWIRSGMLAAKEVGERYVGVEPGHLNAFLKTYVQDAKATRRIDKKPVRRAAKKASSSPKAVSPKIPQTSKKSAAKPGKSAGARSKRR